MKNVLMVAYSFPPAGGPGVQRSLKFAKYLGLFGWTPFILTRDVKNMRLKDESLIKDIPEGVGIYRTNPYELTELKGVPGLVGKFAARKVLIPDGERLWELFSKKTAVEIIKNDGIELIYTTSVPYSSHLLGLYLKKTFPGIPWVADFRDEWTNNPYLLDNPHNTARMAIERGMERSILKRADYMVANTPVMLENFLRDNKGIGLEERSCVIPNGYDKEDFKFLENIPQKNTVFTITYTGSLYGRRKPDNFFLSLQELIAEGKADPEKIRIRFIGAYKKEQMAQTLEKYGLQGIVEILPYMDHDGCIRKMAASDALLLIEGGGPGGKAFHTGKLFEYLAAGRPILANIPAGGAAARLISETGSGLISDCGDTGKTGENILKLYEAWHENKNIPEPDRAQIAKYDRKVLTGELARIFDRVCSKNTYPSISKEYARLRLLRR